MRRRSNFFLFPAQAGLHRVSSILAVTCVPRISGDKPLMRNQYHQFPASAGIFICVALVVGPATTSTVARPDWVMSPSDGGPVYEKAPAGARAWEVSGDFQLHDV